MTIGKIVSTYADDVWRLAKNVAKTPAQRVDVANEIADALLKVKTATRPTKGVNIAGLNRLKSLKGKVHYASGEILAMQNAKPRKITVESIPTQQYIDDMLGIKPFDKAEHLARYKDLKYAFNHPGIGKAKPVITESRLTADVVEEMHNTKYIDALKRAEVTGELTEATKQRRTEILEAFETCEPRPIPPKKTLKDIIKGWFRKESNLFLNDVVKTCEKNYNVPGGHVPAWVALEKWAKKLG